MSIQSGVQILFCSRTHSQLSQFVGELRRTKYKDSMSLAALASRQVLKSSANMFETEPFSHILETLL